MVEALLYNKWFWIGVLAVASLIIYELFFSKKKNVKGLEKEYLKILNSEENKVKGQYE